MAHLYRISQRASPRRPVSLQLQLGRIPVPLCIDSPIYFANLQPFFEYVHTRSAARRTGRQRGLVARQRDQGTTDKVVV
eukprot:6184930-Pleurochrysis_carterae.AAC.6